MNKFFIGLFLFLVSLIVPTTVLVKNIKFNQQCGGYLKQAADANTVELALERITIALDYIESHGLTEGYTSVLWKTEDENVGFWYRNINACREELETGKGGTQLETTNLLMKVRESLLDNSGEGGDEITVPDGISRFPNNALWGVLRILSILLMLTSFCLFGWDNVY